MQATKKANEMGWKREKEEEEEQQSHKKMESPIGVGGKTKEKIGGNRARLST